MKDMRIKLEFFLSAMLYFMARADMASGKAFGKLIHKLIYIIIWMLASLFPNKRETILDSYERSYEQMQLNENRSIESAALSVDRMFYLVLMLYQIFFIFITLPLFKRTQMESYLVSGIVGGFMLSMGVIVYFLIYSKDKYLGYFKVFEKKDSRWHTRWKYYTLAFTIGAFASFPLAIFIVNWI